MAKELSSEILTKRKDALKKYVSDPNGDFFVLMNVPVEIAGAAFARYSRAKGGFRETFVREFLDDEGNIIAAKREVLERILLEFGDDSVGELGGAHTSWERISNLATKKIEDKRIGGSPIEQSSRYVEYDMKDASGNWFYYRDPKIMQSRFTDEYVGTMDFFFESYIKVITGLKDFFKTLTPLEEYKSPNGKTIKDVTDEAAVTDFKRMYNFVMKTSACDRARVILPAATLTNLGIFGNGRFYQHVLTSLYSEDLTEMQDIATKQHAQLKTIVETFVKRAQRDEYLVETRKNMQRLASELLHNIKPESSTENVRMIFFNPSYLEEDIIAQALFRYSKHPIEQLRTVIESLSLEKQREILDAYVGQRKSKRDRPGRALEAGYPLSFEIVGDFGSYRDLHRHRMLTQERQDLTTLLGYSYPPEIEQAGFKDLVEECFSRSDTLYKKLYQEFPEEAQYATLFGHNIRYFLGMNVREAMHMWELRTVSQGHPNYRKICQKMHSLAQEKYPSLAQAMKFIDYNDYTHARADSEARIAEKITQYRKKHGVTIEREA